MLKARGLILQYAQPEEIEKLYRFWRENWGREFKDQGLAGIDTLNSDDFRHSDIVRSVWVGEKIVAMMLVSRFDLSLEWDRTASYFNGWPPEFFEQHKGQTVRALRYFLVAPDFRRNREFRPGALMLGLCMKDFAKSDDDVLCGMTLKKFGAHTLTHKFGLARVGEDGKTKHGVSVEYGTVLRNSVNLEFTRSLTESVFDEFEERTSEHLLRSVGDQNGRRSA